MTALATVAEAVLAALTAAPGLSALNRVGAGEAERAPVPHAWITEAVAGEWGAKLPEGREIVLVLNIADRGEPARLAGLVAAAEDALRALPRPLAGWDHAGARIRRVRTAQRRDGLRVASIEARLRVLAL